MSGSSAPTLDQRRARHAWEAVACVKVKASTKKKGGSALGANYAREAKRLPVRILTAGLGHALAFVMAKSDSGSESEDAHTLLLRDIAHWVLHVRDAPDSSAALPVADALIEKIVKRDADFFQVTTDEVIAYVQWLTRFAEAEFGAGED